MQGVVFMYQNPQHQGPSPNKNNLNMELSPSPEMNITKEKLDQSIRTDSGIFSITNNSLSSENRSPITSENVDESITPDTKNECSIPNRFNCPICSTSFNSQHAFTLHIKSHNNDSELQDDKGFLCRICSKVLSSSSSLDRHVLVHSGERPFHCKCCGDTFTTNGNMNRHMRAHSQKTKNYESDESSDSNNTEYNNNNNNNNNNSKIHVNKKRKLDDEEIICKKKDTINITEYDKRDYKCKVCGRTDFDSSTILEIHMKDNHPDYPTKCHECDSIFINLKQLELHRIVHGNSNSKHSVVGFKDLTFVDFSSEKFPHIARYECEKNLHKSSGSLKFQCRKCNRAFPCSNSLEYHEENCSLSSESKKSLDFSSPKLTETDIRRNDFFSRLNLQDISPEKNYPKSEISTKKHLSFDNNKDLADIQSIISMTTSGSLLQQLQSKSEEFTNNIHKHEIQEFSKNDDEEIQDAFAVEFRKMKLRGEFPCRLCTAIFPNLRALKGHNRAHLNGTNNGSYRCNMCPHTSVDKAALIRHMRTHNGDRPYECSLCNYAFTTKANCERHLRNRHAKSTREEVKKSIIYHPSEDPTNDDINKFTNRDDGKKIHITHDVDNNEKIHCSTPKIEIKSEIRNFPLEGNPLFNNLQAFKESLNLSLSKEPVKLFSNLNEVNENDYRAPYFPQAYDLQNKSNMSKPKIKVKNINSLKYNNSDDDEYDDDDDEEEESNIVLDLSKKRDDESKTEEIPQDLSLKSSSTVTDSIPTPVTDMFQSNFLKSPLKIDSDAFYAQWALLRNSFGGIPGWPTFPINPLFFQQMQEQVTSSSQDLKERLRNQLYGGMVITDNRLDPMQHLRNRTMSQLVFNGRCENLEKKSVDISKSLKLNMEPNLNLNSPVSHSQSEILQSPNSVKMVIKNGILMPKQKQRRYRTERPFTCEHCSARFTLRSNMERHIKQQHPQFWSQRQRGNIGNPGRKQAVNLKSNFNEIIIPNYENQKYPGFNDNKETMDEKLKFAILAQHLSNNFQDNIKKDEEDEDVALVIDENSDEKELDASQSQDIYENNQTVLENKINELKDKQFILGNKVNDENKNQDSNYNIKVKVEDNQDLVSVSRLLDNASQQQFNEYFRKNSEEHEVTGVSEEDEEGLVASGSTSEENISGTDENRSESENAAPIKKKSAYSLAPNRVSCPYCSRKFPWTSSLRRHILTHTGQKPFKCSHCPLLFTTKSNCDRHLLRKHGNSATTITNDVINNNTNYLMRNVPERPFKCSNCPSSTFSTYSNLKKHISCKHATNAQGDDIKAQGYEAGSSEDEKAINDVEKRDIWEQSNKIQETSPNVVNVDQPFKCHLCEFSFGDRQEALDHIKDRHSSEYELLMAKNALDSSVTTPEESAQNEDDENELRGKFPDYANRKVICAFCMRRFWSAEDLRRHMRTHTGERPFSCDICRRRFTLKHSMLRHRKKHNITFNIDNINSDDDVKCLSTKNDIHLTNKKNEKADESDCNDDGDLISNLLGIRPSFIDKVLTSSADDAAKLLGVKNGVKE